MYIPWIVLIIEGLLCSVFANTVDSNSSVMFAIVVLINIFSVVVAIAHQKKAKNITMVMLGGFAFRIVLLVWDLYCSDIYRLPNSGLDSEMFAYTAKSGFFYGEYGRGGTYSKFIVFWYRLFGSVQRPIAQYVNVLLAITSIFVVIKIMNYLKIQERSQAKIIFLMCFLPNFAITNSILLRETLIIFLVSASILYFVKWIYENNVFYFCLSMVGICVASTIHSGAISVLLGEAIILVLYDRRNKSVRLNRNSFIGLAFVLVGFIVIYAKFGDALFGKFQGIDSAADVVATANKYNSGGSAYDAGFQINNNIANLIVNTPIRIFYFVASPLPWTWRGISDMIAFCFSSTVFVYAYYRAYKEIRYGNGKYKTEIIVFTVLTISTALIFAWGVSNAGTAARHREKFMAIYMILIVLCDANKYSECGEVQ
jgi:hypothetical protein